MVTLEKKVYRILQMYRMYRTQKIEYTFLCMIDVHMYRMYRITPFYTPPLAYNKKKKILILKKIYTL